MLLTDLSTVALVFLVLIVLALLSLRQFNLEQRVRTAIDYLHSQNKRSVSLAKMAAVEASLSELTDAYDALLASHKKLRSRIGMRAVREAKNNEIPDPASDPAGYKREMRLKLMKGK